MAESVGRLKSYRLLRPIQMAGALKTAGSIVELSDQKAQWLAAQGIVAIGGLIQVPRQNVAPSSTQPVIARPQHKIIRRGCAGCGR